MRAQEAARWTRLAPVGSHRQLVRTSLSLGMRDLDGKYSLKASGGKQAFVFLLFLPEMQKLEQAAGSAEGLKRPQKPRLSTSPPPKALGHCWRVDKLL